MIGKNIRKIMSSKRITQAELSRISGVHTTHINRILNGVGSSPSTPTLQKLAEALDVPITSFYTEDATQEVILKQLANSQPEEILDFLSQPENSGWIALMVWGKDIGMTEEEVRNILTLYKNIKAGSAENTQ